MHTKEASDLKKKEGFHGGGVYIFLAITSISGPKKVKISKFPQFYSKK